MADWFVGVLIQVKVDDVKVSPSAVVSLCLHLQETKVRGDNSADCRPVNFIFRRRDSFDEKDILKAIDILLGGYK